MKSIACIRVAPRLSLDLSTNFSPFTNTHRLDLVQRNIGSSQSSYSQSSAVANLYERPPTRLRGTRDVLFNRLRHCPYFRMRTCRYAIAASFALTIPDRSAYGKKATVVLQSSLTYTRQYNTLHLFIIAPRQDQPSLHLVHRRLCSPMH